MFFKKLYKRIEDLECKLRPIEHAVQLMNCEKGRHGELKISEYSGTPYERIYDPHIYCTVCYKVMDTQKKEKKVDV